MNVFRPKCIYSKSEDIYSNNGYIMPCCDCDNRLAKKDERIKKLTAEHLKVDNVESIEHIFLSEEWIEFFEMIIEGEDVPDICMSRCGSAGPPKHAAERVKII